jgi:exo-beta-1,3-glucanase (GH17 family)
MQTDRRATQAAAALAAFTLLLCASWWRDGRPVAIPDGTASPLQCISYAPSRATATMPVTVSRRQIHRDLTLLASRTSCIRTYTVSRGFDAVPEIARELGLKVLLGAWLGRNPLDNEVELRKLIATAKANRDVIRAVVVGNEVLLRHELRPAELAGLIKRVRSATGLPVTYADVWGYWLKHRELAEAVSFVTVHVLPYWDDNPVGIDRVIPYVEALYGQMRARFPRKEVLIGETGWPSAGRPRGAVEPSRVNQARYLREFTAVAEREGIPYNLIEAFDQPWKQRSEGTVGGHWGLYDRAGRAKFPWAGPVVEVPRARWIAIIALCAGLFASLVAWQRGRGRSTAAHRRQYAAGGGIATALAVTVVPHQSIYLLEANLSWQDWATTVPVAVAGWLCLAIVLWRMAMHRQADGYAAPRAITLPLLAAFAYVSLGLAFAGRHRDFPVWLFLPFVLALAASAWASPASCANRLVRRRATEEVVIAGWLIIAGAVIPAIERFANARSIAWGLSAAVLGSSILVPLALQARQDQRATERAET